MGCSKSKNVILDAIPQHGSTNYDDIPSRKRSFPTPTRFIENFRTVWLYDENSNKFEHDIRYLRKTIYGLKTINNVDACFHFINEVLDEKIFLIVSGTHRPLEYFYHLPQLEKIYIFDPFHEHKSTGFSTLKYDLIHSVDNLYKQLEEDMKLCEVDWTFIATMPAPSDFISFSSEFTKQQAGFIFLQTLKEVIKHFKFESAAKDILIDFCHEHYINNEEQLLVIDKFAKNYRPNKALWYLTNPGFISRILNRVERTHELDIIYKFGFFLKQVHIQLNRLYQENKSLMQQISTVYRGKTMPFTEFDSTIKNNCGGFLAFSNFLIATTKKKLAIDFIDRRLATHSDRIGIIFEIDISTEFFDEENPFALLKDPDMNKDEVCFYVSTMFRIEAVEQITNGEMMIWSVKLKLLDDNDPQVQYIMNPIRNEEVHADPVFYVGRLLIDMKEFRRAEQFLPDLLQDSAVLSQPRRLARVNKGLAAMYTYNHDYQKAIYHYQQALRFSLTYLPTDHPNLVPIYQAIGDNYFKQKDYYHALENYEKAIEAIEQNSSQINSEILTDLHDCIYRTKQLIENHE